MDLDPNNTVLVDPSNLNTEELREVYLKLWNFYLDIKKTNEACLQEIYELKRNVSTANATERFLTQELESIQSTHKDDLNQLNEKFRTQLNDTKTRSHELSNLNAQLELKVEELEVKAKNLEQELLERNDVSAEVSTTQFDLKEIEWEKKNTELVELSTELSKRVNDLEGQIYKLQSENVCLKERLECAEDNFFSKKEEVQERDIVIDGLHEKLIELTAELNSIKNCPPEQSKKGNSLFAEVDDQRQLMKNILAKQKKQYMQMQKQFSEREYEIRRLKQENAAIHKEMEICSSIFTKADTNYRNELEKRIKNLMDEEKQLEEKLKLNEKFLSEMSNNKGMNWVDTIMSHCKNENDEIKKKYHFCLLEKSFLEESYLKSQQTLAKWRFEALKSRCIIIDREEKLTEHKIPFESVKFIPRDTELQNLEPIVTFNPTTVKQEDQVPVHEQLGSFQNTSSYGVLTTIDDIKKEIDIKLDLSDENIENLSSPPLLKLEKMDTSDDYTLSESSMSSNLSVKMSPSPPPPANPKLFSIFCDSIVDDTRQENDIGSNQHEISTLNVELDLNRTIVSLPKVIISQENIKPELDTKPVRLEKSDDIINSTKKKNNLIIRKVFIKSKK